MHCAVSSLFQDCKSKLQVNFPNSGLTVKENTEKKSITDLKYSGSYTAHLQTRGRKLMLLLYIYSNYCLLLTSAKKPKPQPWDTYEAKNKRFI